MGELLDLRLSAGWIEKGFRRPPGRPQNHRRDEDMQSLIAHYVSEHSSEVDRIRADFRRCASAVFYDCRADDARKRRVTEKLIQRLNRRLGPANERLRAAVIEEMRAQYPQLKTDALRKAIYRLSAGTGLPRRPPGWLGPE